MILEYIHGYYLEFLSLYTSFWRPVFIFSAFASSFSYILKVAIIKRIYDSEVQNI